MAIDYFRLEKGIHIYAPDTEAGVTILRAAGVPSATSDEDAAERGSFLFTEDGNGVYYKDTSGAGASAWVKLADHAYIASVLGISEGDLNFGTFTGTLLADNQDAKTLFQTLETEVESLRTLSGTSAGVDDLGTFTGTTISDNTTIKNALQELETAVEATGDEVFEGTFSAVTTATTVNTVLVDNVFAAKWFVQCELDSDDTSRRAFEVYAVHDGGAATDATEADWNNISIVKVGSSIDVDVDVVLSGTGASQTMGLQLTASSAISGSFIRLSV